MNFRIQVAYYVVCFIIFMGFYSVNLIVLELLGPGYSKPLSIGVRFLALLGLMFMIFFDWLRIRRSYFLVSTLLFFLLYSGRILFDHIQGREFYLGYFELFLYLCGYFLLPFISFFLANWSEQRLSIVRRSIVDSSLLFFMLVIFFYGSKLGSVVRLDEEGFISPLILSYSSVLYIGVVAAHMMHNTVPKSKKVVYFLGIVLSMGPFILGNSRGAMLALVLPFVVMFLSRPRVKMLRGAIGALFALSLLVLYNLEFFKSTIFRRINVLFEGSHNANSNARVMIWESAINQWLDHPFLGDQLAVTDWHNYAHNVIVEILHTTGLIGFLLMSPVIVGGAVCGIRIFRKQPAYSWVGVFFFQALIQAFFSGAIYLNIWLWISISLVISLVIKNDRFK